jgi:hypothetical protein
MSGRLTDGKKSVDECRLPVVCSLLNQSDLSPKVRVLGLQSSDGILKHTGLCKPHGL